MYQCRLSKGQVSISKANGSEPDESAMPRLDGNWINMSSSFLKRLFGLTGRMDGAMIDDHRTPIGRPQISGTK